MKSVVKIIAVMLAILMLGSLAACEDDDDIGAVYQPYDNENMGDGSGDASGSNVATNEPSKNELPEDLICAWEVVDIYQEAEVSEISAQVALEKERQSGLLFGYNTFSRSGEYVENAMFDINYSASYDEMYKYFGIQTETLIEAYGADAEVISISISTDDGTPCTTVYVISRSVLVAFGEGMNVFTYQMVESVG